MQNLKLGFDTLAVLLSNILNAWLSSIGPSLCSRSTGHPGKIVTSNCVEFNSLSNSADSNCSHVQLLNVSFQYTMLKDGTHQHQHVCTPLESPPVGHLMWNCCTSQNN